jgi:rare lipoprotein A (peptidoglycan hydrolase)
MRRGWVALLGMALVVATGCSPVHRPRVTAQVAPATGDSQEGVASWYGPGFHGKRTSSGERYDQYDLTAAHRTLPLGTWVVVTNRLNGRSVRVYVNDRGPYVNKFVIDLSQAAARYLGVDVAEDRSVLIRIIALPGEEPLQEEVLDGVKTLIGETAMLAPTER